MSLRMYTEAESLKMRIERCIRGDIEMGNFSEIDHVLIHSSQAPLLSLGENDDTTRDFLVPCSLDIIISDRPRQSGTPCGLVKLITGEFEPIDLHVDSYTNGCFDIERMIQLLEGAIQDVGYAELQGKCLWIHGVIAFVAILYAKASFAKVVNEMQMDGDAILNDIAFTTKHPFRVRTSVNNPLTVIEDRAQFTCATVDKNGWVVGERTKEEVARIPKGY